MLEVSHLAVDHGQLRALWDVSFKVQRRAGGAARGQRRGQIDDPRRSMGLFRPAGGTILYCGRDVGGRDTADNVEDGIALVPKAGDCFRR